MRPRALERSEELRSVTERLWAAWMRGDADSYVARFSSQGMSGFGTDPTEVFGDLERLERYTRAEFEAMDGPWPFGAAEFDAWREGDVGWSTVQGEVLGDTPTPLRVSFVFRLERDDWKIVHQHWSVGVPNEELLGVRLPLEVLAEVVEEERPDVSAAAAPDGTVTIVFTDIQDSTRLNASFGDHAWMEVLRAHNQLIADATNQHGGTVVKGQGDGFMLAFPSARRALDGTRQIKRDIAATFNDPGSPIRVRIGVHVGEVIQEADDFFGHAVNYAARVAGAARGGEALVSSLVHELVSPTGRFAFDLPRSVVLKGIDGPQLLYPLGSAT
ncbi:MAG: adenylate cyclase [Solirubrobacteraceae bacterium]|jgi:class 3 adenylate cyclase/ketosteroid isomerase-like protein|nr:adenylate cyclase [Solirubrobacteraceae bacterium]